MTRVEATRLCGKDFSENLGCMFVLLLSIDVHMNTGILLECISMNFCFKKKPIKCAAIALSSTCD